MPIHQTIKDQIKDALRAKDTLKLETLRGLNALFLNDLIANPPQSPDASTDTLSDDKALALVKRSVKQRKDSIEQFEKGGRKDLADKERAELAILDSFMPAMMSRHDIRVYAQKKVGELKASGKLDPKSSGKIVGSLMKELAGRADGNDVKAVVDELIAK